MSYSQDAAACTTQVEAQLNEIDDEIKLSPLLSASEQLAPGCRLEREFEHDAVFLQKVRSLYITKDGQPGPYHSIRYARRDGNCFYRCASFRLLELMLQHPPLAAEFRDALPELKEKMLKLFGEYSADFAEVVEDVLSKIIQGSCSSSEDLLKEVTSSEAGYVIVFFRYAVSLHIRENKEVFLPYITSLDYCVSEVEPVDHVSDEVQLVAFAQLFNVVVKVQYLDRSPGDTTTPHTMGSEDVNRGQYTICLLFRPGHYDLLEV